MSNPDFEPPCAAGRAHADIRRPDAAVDYRERLNRLLPPYPDARPPDPELRPALHPLCQQLNAGISEFTFANLFLFRHAHNYALSRLDDDTPVILGRDGDTPFFMLPFGLPGQALLDRLFHDHGMLKAASSEQAEQLRGLGFDVREDRDHFDYLYRREDLAQLSGRTYSKKRNLIKAFLREHEYEARPLREEYLGDALQVLEAWRAGVGQDGDYRAAREGLERMDELQLCGGVYYVADQPVAYVLGEELAGAASFLIHFEKAVAGYKGLYQFINQSFAAILPADYATINREQDLGDPGLRQAKLSYRPSGFVEKFRVFPA